MDGVADLVFTGGRVFTANALHPWCEAVAVRDGSIVAAGSDADMTDRVGPGTDVVELRGRMLLPGFQDAHVHAPAAGVTMLGLDLSGDRSPRDYDRLIRTFADTHPGDPWVVGSGWRAIAFPDASPSRDALDALVPDRPVFLSDSNNHAAWVNSRALELAGISADTLDPIDGRIVRDGRGAPTGMLLEGAIDLVSRLLPRSSPEDLRAGLLAAQAYLHSLGITAWQDAIVGEYATIQDNFDCYLDADSRGELTARVAGALWFRRRTGLEQLPFLRERRDLAREGRFRATSVKLMVDGACENHAAALRAPYLDAADDRGIEFFSAEELREAVVALDADGFQAHIHALGDQAIGAALDALEAARAENGVRDHRHHLAHLQLPDPADIPRFAALDVTANVQPLWAAHSLALDRLVLPAVGEERSGWLFPFSSFERAGVRLAFGSDWPISSPDPLLGIHVAVDRISSGDEGAVPPLLAEQKLDLSTALTAATRGSAFVNRLDDVTGSIEVGKLADLVVLDQDLFTGPTSEIGQASVVLTFVDGRPVYEAPGWER